MYIFIEYHRLTCVSSILNDYNYPGFPLNLFEEWKDLMRTERRHGAMGILLELRSVEAPQLHGAHVCGEEGLPQLKGWGGML